MSDYWEKRAAWDIYENMADAEDTADLIARVYRSASTQIVLSAQDIFEKYMTKHKLSKAEAWRLLNSIQNRDSIQKLLLELKNKDSGENKQELLKELEAPAYRVRIERLQGLLQQVDTVMQNVYQQEQQFDTNFFEQLAENAYYRTIYNTQRKTGLGFSFSHIDQKQIDQALRINWSGKHYSKRIWKNTDDLAQTVKDELLVSLLTGRTDRETAAVITEKFGGGAIKARRLIRTESCFFSGELTAQAYEECGIKKYRYVATLDLRTSKICRELDGKVFLVSQRQAGKNYPPMHPWCRSTTISDIDDEALSRMTRAAYNPETGRTEKVPANMTYDEWYQKYVKGNAKAEAQEKAVKNASSDRKQFDKYRKVLGNDMPKDFADFQDLKYNDPEEWEKLKTLEHYLEKNSGNTRQDYDVQIALKEAGVKGIAKANPEKLDVSDYSYDTVHINTERAHMVSRKDAERFIKESDLSLTRWNGRFINYYSKDGATYVDVENKNIRTAFTSKEFDENTLKIREVAEKYAGKNSHMSNIKKAD